MSAVCRRDCFHCPYPDCIVDDESLLEIHRAEHRDHMAQYKSSMIDQSNRKPAKKRINKRDPESLRKRSEINSRYYQANRQWIAEYKRQWYLQNRERILAVQAAYRKKKKGELSDGIQKV